MVLVSADELSANNQVEELQRRRIKGEAHFLRALYYFTLVNLYGQPYCPKNVATPAVPLKLTEFVEDKDYVVNTVEEVYARVLADLEEADAYLKGNEVKNHPYRADITAVYLLKSRVYLYMQNWNRALEYAGKVLESRGGIGGFEYACCRGGSVYEGFSGDDLFYGRTCFVGLYVFFPGGG